ncbi:unnamed protein product [Enterobius vermicularis]|uniref:Transmembrane protein n=1 Tax=Enterobius vermicularis TaxID=51028 RepID=A0A0N4V3A2_ENTVE|nr:unnamed protein product [Enterobius vermicularis]
MIFDHCVLWILHSWIWFLVLVAAVESDDCKVRELSYLPIKVAPKASAWSPTLDLYLFRGYERVPSHLFLDAHVQINLTDVRVYQVVTVKVDFSLSITCDIILELTCKQERLWNYSSFRIYFQGENCSAVLEQYNDDHRLFGVLRHFSFAHSKHLNPFDRTVIGIATNEAYVVRLKIWEINYFRAIAFIGAIILYLLSYFLVRNALFFYSSGCAFGVIASLLIVGFTVYRFAPKKWLFGVPLLFGGWSVSFYTVYFLWKNFTAIVLKYQKFVIAYFATIIIISFAVCYRYGPPTDVRSHNLAQWALQLLALLIIYFSCQRQGAEETRKAMEKLRKFCRSPNANAWRITSAIKDPKRFASFIEGSSDHVTQEEIDLYENESKNAGQLSDDSGEDELLFNSRNRGLELSGRNSSPVRSRLYYSGEFAHFHGDNGPELADFGEDDGENNILENPHPDWEEDARNSSFGRLRSGYMRQLSHSESGYNGLLMPAPRMPRSDPDQLCSFYQLTPQQVSIYRFLREKGMGRGNDYIGESEHSIKQGIPEEYFDEYEFDEDLARLVEVDLIQESILDGYWGVK